MANEPQEHLVPAVEELLLSTAKARSTIPFSRLFELFPEKTDQGSVYRTLEKAATNISPSDNANYTSLMAKKDTGMPGPGFFDTFEIKRRDEYRAIASTTHHTDLTQEQMVQMVEPERARVYEHAKTL